MKMPKFNIGDKVYADGVFGIIIAEISICYYDKETQGWHYYFKGNAKKYRENELKLFFYESFAIEYKVDI